MRHMDRYQVTDCHSGHCDGKEREHPCFSQTAHQKYARMHLPVAPKCNIGCNYCNRKYDCCNESRPGVSSQILTPSEAFKRFIMVKEKIDNLSVVGIAGPGDALADWENTSSALSLIHSADHHMQFCLSTNGLLLKDYLEEMIALGIQYVTVTINCVDPEIGEKIYRYVNYHGRQYRGWEGAALLLEKQLEGIALLKMYGLMVKVNTVMIADINAHHIPEIANKIKDMGVFVHNIVPLIPVAGTAFENYAQTSMSELAAMRERCRQDLAQMNHCRQCRADAIGMLHEDHCLDFIQAG